MQPFLVYCVFLSDKMINDRSNYDSNDAGDGKFDRESKRENHNPYIKFDRIGQTKVHAVIQP